MIQARVGNFDTTVCRFSYYHALNASVRSTRSFFWHYRYEKIVRRCLGLDRNYKIICSLDVVGKDLFAVLEFVIILLCCSAEFGLFVNLPSFSLLRQLKV